jgi:protocatechuate 3,4-dioxygenase beta subunit
VSKPSRPLSRRDLLEKCAAAGLLGLSWPLRGDAAALFLAALRRATPGNGTGPFYRPGAPASGALRAPGDPGMPLVVTGRVVDTRGETLEDAVVEVWQADHFGHYDTAGFRYRGTPPLTRGAYRFESVMPGHYPGRIAQHVHYRVSAPGHATLATQLYFATDAVFQGDPDRNFGNDPMIPSRELVRPVTLTGRQDAPQAAVDFEICLERL